MIKVLNPGLLSTVQDLGRIGYQGQGVPVSGAMDTLALKLGNILNGNDENACGIEMTYSGFSCTFLKDTSIALTGGDLGYKLNGVKVAMNETLYVIKGDVLTCEAVNKGIRGYLTVAGGILIPNVLGSCSTYLRGKMGGLEGRKLKAGDLLKTGGDSVLYSKRTLPTDIIDTIYKKESLKVILGPEDDYFESIEPFFEGDYVLTPESDRMGFRLSGTKLKHKASADILSAGLTFGSIQIPGSGQPIIMMADRQPTGGYSKVGQVQSVDLSYLAQKAPGEKVKFELTSVEDAQSELREFYSHLNKWQETLSGQRRESDKGRRFTIGLLSKSFNIKVEEV